MENIMYRYNEQLNQLSCFNNFFSCDRNLDPNNRWVMLSKIIPWDKIEKKYSKLFSDAGSPGKTIRLALGAMIIKERMVITDEETRLQIIENPYLQYFVGYDQYGIKSPFDQSSMTRFRKRFTIEVMKDINEMICQAEKDNSDDDKKDPPAGRNNSNNEPCEENKGTLILDASCIPADIHYPTDVTLINDAREILEEVIDVLHKPLIGIHKKPRTYRVKARKQFLEFIKRRKPGYKIIRKTIRQQLGFVGRDLRIIEAIAKESDLELLNRQQYKKLLVIQQLYQQQKFMYENKVHKVEDRIVSIHQPHIRPIVRGKASAAVEFGAKITMSVVEGLTYLERLSFDSYNECQDLITATEEYKRRHGCYPETILVDKIFRTRENRSFCKENRIHINGPRLGRPPANESQEEKYNNRIDEGRRNQIEGKFGEAKRRYGLNRILTRLPETSECTIAVNCIVMNLEHLLRKAYYFVEIYFARRENQIDRATLERTLIFQ